MRCKLASLLPLVLLFASCGRKAEEPDLGQLVATLRTSDEIGRGKATTTLITMGERAVPAIVPLLSDPEPRTRRVAAATLWGMGPKARGAVPELAATLRDPDSSVRAAAAMALDAIGPEARTAVPALTRALRDRDHSVRLWAVRALGAMGAEAVSALPVLEGMVKDEYLGPEAVEAVRRIRAAASMAGGPSPRRRRSR